MYTEDCFMIKVGYQGIEGSNSEEAAKKLCETKGIKEFELVPLVTSRGVVEKLNRNEVDYGVMAYKNNIGGKVQETIDALSMINYELVGRCELLIHHCIFVLDSSIKLSNITKVVSHEQALVQCQHYIQSRFPQAEIVRSLDTAISARQLRDGVIDKTAAIICKKTAGTSRDLYLIDENIEDEESITEFRIIKKGKYDISNSTDIDGKTQRRRDFLKLLTNNYSYLSLMFLCVVLCILGGCINLYFYAAVGVIFLTVVILLLLRRYLRLKIPVTNVIGYWKYYSSAVSGFDPNQMHDYLRIVEIYQRVDGLHLTIWMGTDFSTPYVISTKILATDIESCNGNLIYWYTGTVNIHTNASITGIAVLEWNIEAKSKQINSMSGWYLGAASKEIGAIKYTRISKEEFDYIKNSKVLRI